MKRTHYLAGLMLSIALFSCSDEQLAGADGDNQKEAKEQPKVEISVDADNAVIGLPGKAPMTRGNETITTKGDDITGYLKYKEGNKITTDLIIGMQVGDNGTKCFFHLAGSNEIKRSSEGNYYIELKKDNNNYNLSSNNGASGSIPVYSGNYESFKNEYTAYPDQLKAYVAAVVGGEFDAASATSRFAPSMNCDPERNGYTSSNTKVPKNFAFITKNNDAVEMDIPLTTDRWQEIGKGRITQLGEKWNIDLSEIVLDLKPSGSIVALTYKNTEVEERDYDWTKVRKSVKAWIDAIKIEKLNKNENISFPMIAKVGFDTDNWNGKETLKPIRDFIGDEKIYLNGDNIGTVQAESYSSPIYLWGTGKGEIKVTFFLTKLREVNQKDDKVPYFDGWVDVFKGEEKVGHFYYPTQEYCTQFIKNFNGMESGKTYYAKFDTNYRREEEEKNGIGIIMTEYCVPVGFKDNASKAMVEIYNPTDHPIDLRDYGFIRLIDYDKYIGYKDGGANFVDDINLSMVQELYMLLPRYGGDGNERKGKTYLWNNENLGLRNEFYDRYDNSGAVRYAPYLGPRQTAVFTGNYNFNKDNTEKVLSKFGYASEFYLKNAIDEKVCLFVVGLYNGNGALGITFSSWEPGTSTLNCSWEGSHDNAAAKKLNGLALIKRNKDMSWRIVDVLGVTIEDKELLEKYNVNTLEDKQKWYQKAFGTQAFNNNGEPIFGYDKGVYYTNIVRNTKGEFANKQNPHFLRFENGQLKSVLGTDPNKDLWLVCPYNQNKGYYFPGASYAQSMGRRFAWK